VEKVRDCVGLTEFALGIIILPAERHHPAFSQVTMELEFAKWKFLETCDKCHLLGWAIMSDV